MSGKDLLDVLSGIDDRFIEEAEIERLFIPWRRFGTKAACLCLLLAAVWGRFCPIETPQLSEDQQPTDPPKQSAAAETVETVSVTEVPSVILLVDHQTEDGFVGTVAALVDTDRIPLGTELRVRFAEGTLAEAAVADAEEWKSQNGPAPGTLISVQFIEYDPESGIILVNAINQILPGKDD